MPAPFGSVSGRRARLVPPVSVAAGSLLAALPVVATAPALPPFGLLMVLAWRLLRPEMWPAWAALPLGLFDDLASGRPIGSGMALWTLVFLAIERLDRRTGLRDHWFDWSIATLAIIFVEAGGVASEMQPPSAVVTILPQMAMTMLCYPAAARVAAALDRWRLRR